MSFLFRIASAMHDLLRFCINLEVFFSRSSVKNISWNLDGNCIGSVNYFLQFVDFIPLILPIQEHGMSLHHLSSLISFFSGLHVSVYRS